MKFNVNVIISYVFLTKLESEPAGQRAQLKIYRTNIRVATPSHRN